MEKIDLKEIERNVYGAMFIDGLWDIYLGLLLIGMGAAELIEGIIPYPLNYFIWVILAFPILKLSKRHITEPRLGIVNFSTKKKAKEKKLIIVLLGTILLWIASLIIDSTTSIKTEWDELLGGYPAAVVGSLFLALTLSLIAYFLDYYRLYYYAVLFGSGNMLGKVISTWISEEVSQFVAYGIVGSIMMIIGVVFLVRFINDYPIFTEDLASDEENE